MRSIAIKIGVNAVALWVAALVIPGIHLGEDADQLSNRLLTIVLVALLFGVINALVKPIAMLFSLPFIILTLGLFLLVVNAAMLLLTAWVADQFDIGFTVDGFWVAVVGALVISLVGMLTESLLGGD